MALTDDVGAHAPAPPLRERLAPTFERFERMLAPLGLGWLVSFARLMVGDRPLQQLQEIWHGLFVPVIAIACFIGLWAELAPRVVTSLGAIPGPAQVWEQTEVLWADHVAERGNETAYYERQEKRNAAKLAKDPNAKVKWRTYIGRPTYLDQILTSLMTVFTGFLLASLIAIPLGVLCGLSSTFNAALNPIIQIFKPVSPLAWLPIVTMVVSAVYIEERAGMPKSFVTSAVTVTLCSLWPTLINTAIGVASIDRDLVNVGRVLKLSWWTKIFKVVLPSALPYIFTGLRLSLGVGWMVLIAAEMLAQNPGLGKFVWDEFQNGSSDSLARIMVAVLTVGVIGFLLDRLMVVIQTAFTHGPAR
jgi:nitrate/nitrite transport system permease protein